MKLKFIGEYTGGRNSIEMGEYLFVGRDPVEVDPGTSMGRRLKGNPDFEEVGPLDHDGNGEPGGSLSGEQATAKKRGRPKKDN